MSSNSVRKVKVPTLSHKTNFPNSTFTLSDYFSCTTDSSYQIVYFQWGMMIYQVTYKLNENSMDTDYLRDGFQKLLNIVLKWFHTQKHFHQARNGLLDLLFFPIKIFTKWKSLTFHQRRKWILSHPFIHIDTSHQMIREFVSTTECGYIIIKRSFRCFVSLTRWLS